METIFMSAENSKINKPHKFVPNLLQRLDLRNMLLFKTYLFITCWKISRNNLKTRNSK